MPRSIAADQLRDALGEADEEGAWVSVSSEGGESIPDGSFDGASEGSLEGPNEGLTEGGLLGTLEGVSLGTEERATDGD